MKKGISCLLLLFSLLFALASIAGVFMCGISVIQYLFGEGGRYALTLAGFLMAIIGKILASACLYTANKTDDSRYSELRKFVNNTHTTMMMTTTFEENNE